MKKLLCFTLTALLISVSLSLATDYSSPYTDPSGTSGNTVYSELDVFGDIMGTIPSTNPGTNNAWVGMAWANGELIQFKNIYPNTVPSQFLRINPATGAVIATVNLPFNGFVMGGCFDGTNLWVAQWSPTNVIWCVSLTGTAVSSFVPTTAGYSARCPNWDGTYLWVGCNLGSANTKLIKMTTTGTNVQEWMTGTAVGWYMGGEFSSNAPTGANLYVVDNVGNSLKRLSLGTSITVAAQVNSPAVAPDVAEGLTFDGEYLWHCGAYASAGVVWKIDDGFPGIIPNVTIDLEPVGGTPVIPYTGGSFDFNATIDNNEATTQSFSVWIMVQLPSGSWYGPVLGPLALSLPANTVITRLRTQAVPASAPAGPYVYEGRIGSYPGSIWDSDSFPFSKSSPPPGAGGSMGGEWLNTGDNFVPETVGLNNYPNPFNPTTTINFSLPASGYTTLTVYDLSGRQVAQLVNGYREVGSHQVTLDGSALASGVYLYRLNSAGQTSIAKMVLTK